jgi:CheY-like chemotaxis protein
MVVDDEHPLGHHADDPRSVPLMGDRAPRVQRRRDVVVLVEDHPLHARLLRRAIADRLPGCRVEVFADGAAAVRRLLDRAAPVPDLLVLDLELPGRSGHELLADRAAQERLRGVPTVVVTSSTAVADEQRSLALGATMHVRKPVDPDGFARLAEGLTALLR